MPVSNERTHAFSSNVAATPAPVSNECSHAFISYAAATPVPSELPDTTDATPISRECAKPYNSSADAIPVSNERAHTSSSNFAVSGYGPRWTATHGDSKQIYLYTTP